MNDEIHLLESNAEPFDQDRRWYVYLLLLLDCSAFKVGFSCNPLQRIHSFSRRYFERFDLHQSVYLRLRTCDDSRALESTLKKTFAESRIEAPSWVPMESGGHTEWFSAVDFPQAERRLSGLATSTEEVISAADFIRERLTQLSSTFERWACNQADLLYDDAISTRLGYHRRVQADSLRDWLDTYRFFEIPLFQENRAIEEFIIKSTRLFG